MCDIVARAAVEPHLGQKSFDRFRRQVNPLLQRPEAQVVGKCPREKICGLSDHTHTPAQFSWWNLPVVAPFKPYRTARGLVQTIVSSRRKEDLPAPLGPTTTTTLPVGIVTVTSSTM